MSGSRARVGLGMWLALALWSTCSAASADTVLRLTNVPIAGPVLAGQQLLWAEQRPDHGADVDTAPSRGAPRTLQTFPGNGVVGAIVHLAASAQRWALDVHAESLARLAGPATEQVFTGPVGSVMEPLYDPCASPYAAAPRSIAVDRQRVAYPGASSTGLGPDHGNGVSDCGDRAPGAVLTDFSASPPATTHLQDGAYGLRIAGGFAAWLSDSASGTEVVVYDLNGRRMAYDVTIPAGIRGASPLFGLVGSIDLRPDGTVAFAYYLPIHRQLRMRVGWASPQQAWLHVLLATMPHYSVRLAGDLLEVAAAPESATGTISDATLTVVTLVSGRLLHVVARGVDDELGNEKFDFDGNSLTYVTRTCGGAQIHVTDLRTHPARYHVPTGCRLHLTAPLRVTHEQHVVVKFSCAGMTTLCQGQQGVMTLAGPRRTVLAKSDPAVQNFPLTLTLTKIGRELIARRPNLRVRLTMEVSDDIQSSTTNLTERRSAIVTLPARRP